MKRKARPYRHDRRGPLRPPPEGRLDLAGVGDRYRWIDDSDQFAFHEKAGVGVAQEADFR